MNFTNWKRNKQKVQNFVLPFRWKLEGEKCSKTFFKVLQRKYSLLAFSNLKKNSMKNFTPKK